MWQYKVNSKLMKTRIWNTSFSNRCVSFPLVFLLHLREAERWMKADFTTACKMSLVSTDFSAKALGSWASLYCCMQTFLNGAPSCSFLFLALSRGNSPQQVMCGHLVWHSGRPSHSAMSSHILSCRMNKWLRTLESSSGIREDRYGNVWEDTTDTALLSYLMEMYLVI